MTIPTSQTDTSSTAEATAPGTVAGGKVRGYRLDGYTSAEEAEKACLPYFRKYLEPHGYEWVGWYVDQHVHLGGGIRTRPAVLQMNRQNRPGDIVLVTTIREMCYRSTGMSLPSIVMLVDTDQIAVHFVSEQIVVAEGTQWYETICMLRDWTIDVCRHAKRNLRREGKASTLLRGFRWTSHGKIKPIPFQIRLLREIAEWRRLGWTLGQTLTEVTKRGAEHPARSKVPLSYKHVEVMYQLAGRMNMVLDDIHDRVIRWKDVSPAMRVLCDRRADITRPFASDEGLSLGLRRAEKDVPDKHLSSPVTNAPVETG